MSRDYKIMIRGAGDLATGTIHRLFKAGFRPVVLETAKPTAIRRQVSMCEAVYDKSITVEGVTARLALDLAEALSIAEDGEVPVMIDEKAEAVAQYKPDALIDAIIAKKNLGTSRAMAPLTIALGPGFEAGVDCDYVIETMRGHNLSRIITKGHALPNTGTPGVVGGVSKERVIHSPAAGTIKNIRQIGDTVGAGDVISYVSGPEAPEPVKVVASVSGIIRGLIRDGFTVRKGMKISDIDPRLEEYDNCFTISDKSRAIAGSVLELICADIMNCKS